LKSSEIRRQSIGKVNKTAVIPAGLLLQTRTLERITQLKTINLKLLAVLGFLIWGLGATPGVAQGQAYYVDPSGSDTTGDGSQAHPWASIVFAATKVSAGDTVWINPGIYAGGVIVETGGSAAEPITFQASGPGVVIEGSGGDRDAFFIDGADYVIVDGLTIQHANRAGLRISLADHVTVRNATFADNGKWGLFTDFSDYTTVENSESYGAVDEHGIYISNSSDYPTIRGNRLHNNHDCGLHMNGDISQGGDGIISHGLVENNVIYENGTGGCSGINMDGVTDTLVRNNLLYANHASGISIYQIDGGSGSQNNLIYNNTIHMASDGRWAINIPNTSDTNNRVFNNILYNEHSWRGSISIASSTLPGFASDYNVVMDRFSSDDGDTRISLVEWQQLGYDLHSIIATPPELFMDAVAGDYHLKQGSPAIDQGTPLAEVTQDLQGNPRPAGSAFDIGAYEFTPSLALHALPGDQRILLTWTTNSQPPAGSEWEIAYSGPSGDQPSPIQNIPLAARNYTLSGLTNYAMYTITLNAVLGDAAILSDTLQAMPTDHVLYIPTIQNQP
jgi:parallel beta-helix repeat protein